MTTVRFLMPIRASLLTAVLAEVLHGRFSVCGGFSESLRICLQPFIVSLVWWVLKGCLLWISQSPQRASAALYINVDVRNGNLIKVLIFVGGEMRYRLCIWKYSVC